MVATCHIRQHAKCRGYIGTSAEVHTVPDANTVVPTLSAVHLAQLHPTQTSPVY